jgi:hypothetical protein
MQIIVTVAALVVAFVLGYRVGRIVTRRAVQRLISQGILLPNIPLLFAGAYGDEQHAGYAHQDRTVPVEPTDDDDPATRLRPKFKGPEDPTPYL